MVFVKKIQFNSQKKTCRRKKVKLSLNKVVHNVVLTDNIINLFCFYDKITEKKNSIFIIRATIRRLDHFI